MWTYYKPVTVQHYIAIADCVSWVPRLLLLEVCGSSLLWRFIPVDEVGRVACQGFLVREACVGVVVGGAGSLLSRVQ